ncbi:MAG: hypothetical protein E7181_02280 [Erysipelotrichaceae bacterium]|nr:hypothetical protein [Erysipelotrichaceae bacterium]
MNFFKSYIRRNSFNRHPKAKLLALGGLLFSLGVVTSVATTYAWYTINVLASLPNLNVKITNDTSFDLTIDLLNKTRRINHDDKDHIDEDGNFTGYTLADMDYDPDIGLNDVSGMFASEWMDNADPLTTMPRFRRSYGPTPSSPEASSEATQGYLQTTLLLNASKDCDIYLSTDTGIISADTEETASKKGKELAKLQKVTNTIRLSFYSDDGYYIAYQQDPGVMRNTYYGGPLDMNGDGYYDYVDGKEVFYGEYENSDAINYKHNDEDTAPYEEALRDTFHANHAPGVDYVDAYDREHPNDDIGVNKEDSVNIYELIYDENEPLRPLQSVCSIKAGVEKRLVFSLYCEGWDLDMTDAIESASFNINLGFIALLK